MLCVLRCYLLVPLGPHSCDFFNKAFNPNDYILVTHVPCAGLMPFRCTDSSQRMTSRTDECFAPRPGTTIRSSLCLDWLVFKANKQSLVSILRVKVNVNYPQVSLNSLLLPLRLADIQREFWVTHTSVQTLLQKSGVSNNCLTRFKPICLVSLLFQGFVCLFDCGEAELIVGPGRTVWAIKHCDKAWLVKAHRIITWPTHNHHRSVRYVPMES